MFFTHVSRFLAILGFAVGILQILMGLSIATGIRGLSRYTTATSSGELIDKGMYLVLIAVALGTLAEIGLAVRRARDEE